MPGETQSPAGLDRLDRTPAMSRAIRRSFLDKPARRSMESATRRGLPRKRMRRDRPPLIELARKSRKGALGRRRQFDRDDNGVGGRHIGRSIRRGLACDETDPRRDESRLERLPARDSSPRIRNMDSVAALLIVVFQLFFGWCGEEPQRAPPPGQCEARNC